MKTTLNLRLKLWFCTVLLLLGGFAVEGAFAGDGFYAEAEFDPIQTFQGKLSKVTANVARNQSVRLVLFGFTVGIAALLLYVLFSRSPKGAAFSKWLDKTFAAKTLQKENPPNFDLDSFLHDETRTANRAGTSSASRISPPLSKPEELTETDEKTPLDDDRK